MKTKTGEDKAVLKKKLADLDREWDKACSVSVDRQDKLENAYQELAEFRYIHVYMHTHCLHVLGMFLLYGFARFLCTHCGLPQHVTRVHVVLLCIFLKTCMHVCIHHRK